MTKEMQTTNMKTAGKRAFKDTLFRYIFGEKASLLALYNALNHTDYRDEEELEITTYENAIDMSFKNDVAFIVEDTINRNKALLEKCKPLHDCAYFIARLREYTSQEGNIEGVLTETYGGSED